MSDKSKNATESLIINGRQTENSPELRNLKRSINTNSYFKQYQSPWGAIENGGFENPTLAPWFGTGILLTEQAFVGQQYCFLRTDTYIGQQTLPLDTTRDYRLIFHMARFSGVTAGSVYVSFSGDVNYESQFALSLIPFYRYRRVIFTIPISQLPFADTPAMGVIFIGIDINTFAHVGVDQVFLTPIIEIQPPIR